MKYCSKCESEKELTSFNKDGSRKDGYHIYCKPCVSKNYKTRKKLYPEKFKVSNEKLKNYYAKNREKLLKKTKEYNRNNPEAAAKTRAKSYRKHKAARICQINEVNKKRRKIDPVFHLKYLMRIRVYRVLKSKNLSKSKSLDKYLGCTAEELKTWLESKFLTGMSWQNKGEWHIDHIIPLDSATTAEEIYKLSHFTNLQPLWAIDNIKKGAKIS